MKSKSEVPIGIKFLIGRTSYKNFVWGLSSDLPKRISELSATTREQAFKKAVIEQAKSDLA